MFCLYQIIACVVLLELGFVFRFACIFALMPNKRSWK